MFFMIPSRSTPAVANGEVSFFFMAKEYSMVYMYHFFSIQLSIDGTWLFPYLGYSKNVGVRIYLYELAFWLSLDKRPEGALLGHIAVLCLIF